MKKSRLFAILAGMAVLSFSLFNSCEIGLGESVDTEAPSLSINNPPTSAVVRDAFAISGNWSDDGSIDKISVELKNTGTDQKFSYSGTLDGGRWYCNVDPKKAGAEIKDGKYEATVTIKDNGGHSTTSTRAFIIDNTAPVIVLQRPSTKAQDDDSDLFGQNFTLTGQAADDNNVKKIRVIIYSDPECTVEKHHVDITNVPPTISLDVAKFVAGEVNDYSKIYGSANKDGKKQFYCSIVAYDEAQRYPVSGEQTEADKLGNPTNTYYLYNEIGDILADYKVTELYSIMSGTFTTSDTARAADATNIPAKLSSKVISNGRFSLNPANNPEFKVVGREGLAKDGSAFTNPSNSLANGEPISVKVDVGLDAITLVKESLRPYLLPSDANAKATVADIPENRIYPKLGDKPYEVSGTGYTFTTKITSDECVNANNQPVTLTVGENYIIGMEGKDTKGNEVVAEDGKVFGFRLAPSGAAPIVDIKTCVNPGTGDNASVNNFTSDSMIYVPRYKPEVSPVAESVIRFTGTVDVEDGTPVVEMKIDNGTAQIIPITAVAGQKGEFTFTKDVPVSSFSEPAKPNQHNIVFLVTQTQQTKVTKSIMYQPDAPTVTLSRVEPTAYNYNYGAKVNAGDDGLVETGIPEKVTGTDTVKKFLNGKNVKLNVTIIAGSVGLNEKDANKKAKIEFIQNGVVKKTIASPTFGETDFIDTTEFAEGELLIRITAYDMAGNKTVCEDTYYVDQTTDIPVILPKNSGNSTVKMSKEEAEDLSNVNTNVYSANQTVSYKLIDDDGLASASYTIRNPSITDPNLNIVKSEEISNLNGTTDYQLELTMPETPGTYFISLNTKDINTTAGTGSEQKSKTKSFYIRVTASAPVIENVILMNTTVKGTASISPEVKIKSDQVPFTLERKVKKIVGTDTTAYPIVDAYNKTYTYDGANNTTAAAALNTASPRITDTIDLSNITESGDYVITYKVIDKNGKYGEGTKDITVDLNAPNITQVKVAGDNAYNAATWYNSKTLSLTVTAADITGETGISAVEYSTNGTTWTALSYSDDTAAYEGSAVFSEEGKDKPLYLRARDIAGNVTYFDGTSANGTKNPSTIPSVKVKIDTSAPELSVSSYQIGTLDAVTNIASTKIYVKDGVTLKLSGSYKDEQSTIDNSTLAFDFGKMGNPTIVKGNQNGKDVAQTWTATWTIDKTKTLGALTVKIKNNAGVEKTVSPFEVVLDDEYSIIKNISLVTNSNNTEVYKKSDTEYYVNNTKPFGSSNETPKFTIAGISTDNTGVAKVTLYKGTGSSKIKITDTSSSDFSFTNLDWKNESSDLTLTITATDIAGNENPETLPSGLDPKYKAVTLTVHFDTTAPSALHKTDTKGKDIYFRVGEQENDDITSSDPIWDNDLDKDVGGKYTSGTFGNKETIKIRGNFDETGSGLAMIYYKLFTTTTNIATKITEFEDDPAGKADGYFSPKDASETTRRVFYTGTISGVTPDGSAGGKNYKSIASTYLTTLSGFNTGHNYLVLVAVDNVGNAAVDNINGNYYTINVDTQAPETATIEDIYTAATDALPLAFSIADNPSGANAVQAGIKSVKVKMNGVADEYSAELNTTSGKYEVTIPQNKLPTVSNTYSVSVTALDNAGNSDTRVVGSVIVDKTAPSIRVTSTAGWIKNAISNASVYVNDTNGLKKNDQGKEIVTYNIYRSTDLDTEGKPKSGATSIANGTIEVNTTNSEASTGSISLNPQDGTSWIIRFTAEDIVGNKSYINTEAYTIDRTAPEINDANSGVGGTKTKNAVNADDKWFNATTLTVSGNYTDKAGSLTSGSGVTRIEYTLKNANNSQSTGSWATTNGSYEANLAGFVVGTNTLELKAVDAMGNESAVTKYTVKVDTSKPSVTSGHSSTLYSNGSGTLNINATITDTGSGIQSVVLSREGTNTTVNMTKGSGDVWSADAISLISGLTSGTVSITATATDIAGNETKVAVASVMVDKAGPTININSPAANAKTASTVTLSGTASDGNGAGVDTTTGLTLYYTTNSSVGASAPTSSTIGTTAGSKWVANTTQLTLTGQDWSCEVDTEGFTTANDNTPVYFAVGGKDLSGTGNTGYSSPVAVSVDRKAPVKTLFKVDGKAENTVASTWFNKTTLNVNGTFTDTNGSGVSAILYVLDSGTEKEIPTTNGTYNTNIDGFTTGTHTLKVRAKDAAGNYSSYDTYTVKVDAVTPEISAGYTGVIYADASSCPVELTVTDGGSSGIASVTLTVGDKDPVDCGDPVNGKYTKDIISLLEGGTVSVTATATDNAGNTASRVIANVMLDIDGPELVINTPAANAKTSKSITVSGSASDGTGSGIDITEGISLYYTKTVAVGTVTPTKDTISSWTKYTGTQPTLSGQTWTGTFDATAVATNGNNTTLYICAGAVDTSGSGNQGYSAPVKVIVDRKAPSIASTGVFVDTTNVSTLTSSTSKWFNNTTVNLNGTFTDDGSGVASIRYQLKKGSGSYEDEQTVASDGEFSANVKGLAAGTNTIKVWAVDTAGNTSTAAEYTVKVDNIAPSISAEYTGVIYADSASCPVVLTVTDDGGSTIDKVTLTVGDHDPVDCGDPVDSVNGKYTLDIKDLLSDGTVSVTATAKDKAGNETSRVIANVMLDITGPQLAINTPAANAKTNNVISVSGSANDGTGSGINKDADKGITLYYTTSSSVKANSPTSSTIGTTPASKWVAYGTKPTLIGQSFVGTFNVPDAVAASGSNTTLYICVGAVDKSGSGNPGYSEPVTIVVDRKVPVSSSLTIDEVAGSSLGSSTTTWFNNTTVSLHGTFTDTDGSGVASVKYAVKKAGASAYAADQTIASDGEYTANVKGLAAGTNTIKVWAVDTVGNTSTPAEYTIKVDATAPTISSSHTGVIYASSSSCPVNLTVTDDGSSGLKSVKVTIGDYTGTCTNTSGSAYTIDLQGHIPEGTSSVTAVATDNAGNETSRVIANVMKDETPPDVVINTPSANDKTSATISLSGSISDGVGSGIKKSEGITLYYTKTASVGTVTPTASTISSWTAYGTKMTLDGQTWSGSFTVPTSVAAADANTTLYLCVGAVDNAGTGNKGYSSPVTVVVDKANPAKSSFKVGTTLESDVNTTWFNNETLNINGAFTDAGGSGVSAILYTLDGGTEQEIPTTDGTFNTNIAGFTTGTHTLVVSAKDKVGNESGTSTYTIQVDMTQPVISEVTANDFKQITLANGTLAKTFYFDVADTGSKIATAASSVTAKVGSKTITSGSNGSTISVAAESNEKNRVTVTIGAADLEDLEGNNSVIVTVADQAGNQSNSQSIGTISMDKDAPVPSFASPQANLTVNKTITIKGTVTDASNSEITAVTLKANGSLTFLQVNAWNKQTSYAKDDVVYVEGEQKFYKCKTAHTSGDSFAATTNWNVADHGYIFYSKGQWTATLDTTTIYNEDTSPTANNLTLTLTAKDKADNTSTEKTLALTIDQNDDRPVVKFTNLKREGSGTDASPYRYILQNGDNATLEGTISDDDGTSTSVVKDFKASSIEILDKKASDFTDWASNNSYTVDTYVKKTTNGTTKYYKCKAGHTSSNEVDKTSDENFQKDIAKWQEVTFPTDPALIASTETNFTESTGDFKFTPSNTADGTKYVYFYIKDNNDNEFYTKSSSSQLLRPYQKYKDQSEEDNSAALEYMSDGENPLINYAQLTTYPALTINAWAEATPYTAGTFVYVEDQNHNRTYYKCKKAHTSEDTFAATKTEAQTEVVYWETITPATASLGESCVVGGPTAAAYVATSKNFIEISVAAKDDNGIQRIEITANGTTYKSTVASDGKVTTDSTSGVTTFTTNRIDLTSVAAGSKEVNVLVYDNCGLKSNQKTSFVIDRTPPDIDISTPASDGVTYYGTIKQNVAAGIIGGTDVSKVYFTVSEDPDLTDFDNGIDCTPSAGLSASIVFDGDLTSTANGIHTKNLHDWIKDLRPTTETQWANYNIDENDDNVPLYVYYKAIDTCGNFNVEKRLINVIPNGDKPLVKIAYPENKLNTNNQPVIVPALAGTIRLNGEAETQSYSVDSVYIQLAKYTHYTWGAVKTEEGATEKYYTDIAMTTHPISDNDDTTTDTPDDAKVYYFPETTWGAVKGNTLAAQKAAMKKYYTNVVQGTHPDSSTADTTPVYTLDSTDVWSNWDTSLETLIGEDKYNALYKDLIVNIPGQTGLKGIKASGTADNWNLPINTQKEFETGNITMAIRVYAISDSGKDENGNTKHKLSDPTDQLFIVDYKAPRIGGDDSNNNRLSLQLVQFASEDDAGDLAKIVSRAAYKADMWVTGDWYLLASVYDDNGIKSITLDEHKNAGTKYLVEATTKKSIKTVDAKDCYVTDADTGNFNICIPLPTGAANTSGSITYTIEATENTNANLSSVETVKINYDNTPPKIGTSDYVLESEKMFSNPKVYDEDGFYKLKGYVSDSGTNASGLLGVAFYFVRRGSKNIVYDPMYHQKNSVPIASAKSTTDTLENDDIVYANGLYWKHKTLKTRTDSLSVIELPDDADADVNIHKGGLVMLGGKIYKITNLSANGKTITLNDSAPKSIISADFALALLVDNRNTESQGGRSQDFTTTNRYSYETGYGYGYYPYNANEDDGDLMLERLGGDVEGRWEASIYSKNIPDGPIEIHYVAFDKAQNYTVGIIGNVAKATYEGYSTKDALDAKNTLSVKSDTADKLTSYYQYYCDENNPSKVSNNAPRIASVTVGTDYNGNGSIDPSEMVTEYAGKSITVGGKGKSQSVVDKLILSSDGKSTGNAKITIKDMTQVGFEIIGGNTNIYYQWNIDTAYKEHSAIAETDWNRNNKTGGGYNPMTVTRIKDAEGNDIEGKALDEEGRTYYNASSVDPITFDLDTIKDKVTANNSKVWWTIELWDETEDTTIFSDSQYAELKLPLNVQIYDTTPPNTVISPLYWNSSSDNSVYKNVNGELFGHVELFDDYKTRYTAGENNVKVYTDDLIKDYGEDDKISGIVVFKGFAYDNKRLANLKWAIVNHSDTNAYTSPTYLFPATNGALQNGAAFSNGTWTGSGDLAYNATTKKVTGTYKFEVSDTADGTYLDEKGHKVAWTLTIDTSYIKNVVEQDSRIYVYAQDAAGGTTTITNTAVTSTSTDQETYDKGTSKPTYQVDIVPYITGVDVALGGLKSGNPTVYSRTALGHYTLSDTETVTFHGFNLSGAKYQKTAPAQGVAEQLVDLTGAAGNQLAASNITKSGKVVLKVGDLYTINNMNNNDAKGASATEIDLTANPTGELSTIQNYYNRQPNGDSNNLLTDDVEFDVWHINSNAAPTISGRASQPVMKINPATGQLGFAYVNGPLYFTMGSRLTSGDSTSYDYWMGSYDFFTSIGYTIDKLGYGYGVAAGGDINSNSADHFVLATGRWGTGGRSNRGSYDGSNAFRLEQIAQNNNGTYDFNKERIMSPSLTTAVHGTTTDLYLAYYDDMNAEIRVRAGATNSTEKPTQRFGSFRDSFIPGNNGNSTPQAYNLNYATVIAGKDTGYTAGEYVSIAVVSAEGTTAQNADPDDVLVLVWYDSLHQVLYYTYNTKPLKMPQGQSGYANVNNTTAFETPTPVFSESGIGEYCKIAVDKNGGIHVAAYDSQNANIKYAYRSGYNTGSWTECVVDEFGIVGSELTLDVAYNTANGSPVPYIGYYATSAVRPKLAYLATPGTLKDGSKGDAYTQTWEVSYVPTNSKVPQDHINVGVWKNNGVIANSTTSSRQFANATATAPNPNGNAINTSQNGNGKKDYGATQWGYTFGNGTANPVLGYQIKVGTAGSIETAQKK